MESDFFEGIGRAVDARWTAAGRSPERFPAVAAAVLEEAEPPADLTALAILRDAIRRPRLDALGPDKFGQPPLTLYRGGGFYVSALFWLDGTTSIHEHGNPRPQGAPALARDPGHFAVARTAEADDERHRRPVEVEQCVDEGRPGDDGNGLDWLLDIAAARHRALGEVLRPAFEGLARRYALAQRRSTTTDVTERFALALEMNVPDEAARAELRGRWTEAPGR